MNRLRVRIGTVVREFVLEEAEQHCVDCVELALVRRCRLFNESVIYTPYYLGALAWDIYLDDRKVGHAKAFHYAANPACHNEPTLWSWFIAVALFYVGLC